MRHLFGWKICRDVLRNIGRGSRPEVPAITIEGRRWDQSDEWHGHFETWICLACGRSELFARDCGDVEALAEKYPDQVHIVDAESPKQGPHR